MDIRDHGAGFGDHGSSVRNGGVGVYREFGLETRGWRQSSRIDGTYVENLKDPDEVQPPGRNLVLVVPCVDDPRNRISLSLLDDLPLDIRHGSEARSKRSPIRYTRYTMEINSRRQLFDRLAHRVAELVQALPFQTSTEGKTDAGAHLPKFYIISLIGHRVLEPCSALACQQRMRRRLTLIIPRRMLAETNTALAGVILETSLARFKASMNTFNAEMIPSWSLGCWVLGSMVKTGGRWERIVRRGGSEEFPQGCCEP